jgi:hypothetical protein
MSQRLPSTENQDRVVNTAVTRMLSKSNAWRAMPLGQQQEIALNTAAIVKTLVGGPRSAELAVDPYDAPLDVGNAPGSRGKQPKTGDVINAGVDSAARMVKEIDFPSFVASLVEGTFHAIVKTSIEQMKAYADMVKSVSQSLNEFRDENVSPNQGRDQLVSKYPSLFQVNVDNGQPTVGMKPDADTENLPNFQSDLGLSQAVTDLDDETIENVLVPAARDQLALERQKLLATIILMGINRIVVTDGKINAKILFKFSASENTQTQAQSYDYQNMGTSTTTEGQSEMQYQGASSSQNGVQGASIYATGQYKTTSTPDIRVTDATDTTQSGSIQANGQISGEVNINFKSETFPLEKMVDSGQMMQLQQAQQRSLGRGAPAAGATPAGSGAAPAPAATPAGTAHA